MSTKKKVICILLAVIMVLAVVAAVPAMQGAQAVIDDDPVPAGTLGDEITGTTTPETTGAAETTVPTETTEPAETAAPAMLISAPEEMERYVKLYCAGGSFYGYDTFYVGLTPDGKLPKGFGWYQPVRPDYVFAGWYDQESEGETKYEEGTEVPAEVTVLYAHWDPEPKPSDTTDNYKYGVWLHAFNCSFEGENGGKESVWVEFKEGTRQLPESGELPTVKSGSGEFAGWWTKAPTVEEVKDEEGFSYRQTTSKNGERMDQEGKEVPEGVQVLYAVFDYTRPTTDEGKLVTFYLNWNGMFGKTSALTCTRGFTDGHAPSFTAEDAAVYGLNFSKEYESEFSSHNWTELKAVWEKHTFDGYKFLGWSTSRNGSSSLIETDTQIENGITYYAQWQKVDSSESSDTFTPPTVPEAGPLENMRFDGLTQRAHPGDTLTQNVLCFPLGCQAEVTWKITVGTTTYEVGKDDEELEAKHITAVPNGLSLTVTCGVRTDKTDYGLIITATATGKDGATAECPAPATLGFAHSWGKGNEKKAATCTEGAVTDYTCSVCSTQKTETGYPLEHVYSSSVARGWKIIKPATCTETGEKCRVCLRCGEAKDEVIIIPMLEHDWEEQSRMAVDCLNDTVTYKCHDCDATKVEAELYNGGTTLFIATDNRPHTWGEWTTTKAATTTASGVQTRECSVCHQQEKKSIPKLNTITVSNVTKTASTKSQSFSLGAKASDNAKLTYSSNSSSVTVDSTGKVTVAANFSGSATITVKAAATAQYSAASKTVTVTVNKVNNTITASNVTKTASTKAQSFTLGAKASNGGTLTYSSNNKSVTVDSTGKVTVAANFSGSATITVKSAAAGIYNAASKTVTVTVNKVNNTITASNVTKTASTKSQSFSIGAKVNGGAKLTYSSNNKSVTVSSTGKVTIAANFSGKATITIKSAAAGIYNAASKTITVTVNKISNTITASNVTKTASTKAQSFSIGAKVNGGAKLTYSSSNKSVTVDSTGKVTVAANFSGKATITIKSAAAGIYNAATKTITVTVNKAAATQLPAPKNVTVSSEANGIKVTWSKVTGAEKYRIFYKPAGGSWATAGYSTGTSYTWTGAKSGTTYQIRVWCVTADGKTKTSDYDGIKTIKYLSAPKNVAVSSTTTGIKVTWNAVSGAERYRVFYKPSGGSWATAGYSTGTSYTWTGAKEGTTYQIRVWCVSADGKTKTSAYDGIKTITYK